MSASIPLSRKERDTWVSDWRCALSRLQLEFDVKLSYWNDLANGDQCSSAGHGTVHWQVVSKCTDSNDPDRSETHAQ